MVPENWIITILQMLQLSKKSCLHILTEKKNLYWKPFSAKVFIKNPVQNLRFVVSSENLDI